MSKGKLKWKVSEGRCSFASGEMMFGIDGPQLVTDYEDWGFTKEDAQLVAAAPQLLEALQALIPYLDSIVCYASTCDEYKPNRIAENARAAIAKATGGAT